MYLSELKLWNFRKYGCVSDDLENVNPAATVCFNEHLNVIVGENDSGKTTIVDAIRYILGTQSREWYRLQESDFHGAGETRSRRLRIEAIFRGFCSREAAFFLEWMGFEDQETGREYVLTVRLLGDRKQNRVVMDLRAGPDPIGTQIDGEARELLRVMYLKPLRDAENELTPGRRSRLAQILGAHKLFQKNEGSQEKHELEKVVSEANSKIQNYFSPEVQDAKGAELLQAINRFLEEFFPDGSAPNAVINISGSELSDVLRRLELVLGENTGGLGSLNQLYIAAELLLMQSDEFQGLRLGIIEELEAHLHPQAQLRLINFLEKQIENGRTGQFILTTHSTTLGSSIDLKSLLVLNGNGVFPMAPSYTEMDPDNYDFLHRFLDATKANLFFARGVILVEGDAENLLIPTIANLIDRPLHRYGVSIVNVGSTAFLHYAKIFQRKDGRSTGIPVALVTDMDVKPIEWWEDRGEKGPTIEEIEDNKATNKSDKEKKYNYENTQVFLSPNWTLEYEISLDPLFSNIFYHSILWSEKIQNSKYGKPKDQKADEVLKKSQSDIDDWRKNLDKDIRINEKIAFYIYKKTLIEREISKAIVSQVFAERIANVENKKELKDAILKSHSMRYLVNAIRHVTKDFEEKMQDV